MSAMVIYVEGEMSRRGECPASGGDDGVIRAITAVK